MDWNDVDNSSEAITYAERCGWIIRDTLLGQAKAVGEEVLKRRRELGLPTTGHPVQSYSYLKRGLPQKIASRDPETLEICKLWGIDPAVPMKLQNRATIRAAWERMQVESTIAMAKERAEQALPNPWPQEEDEQVA